jgi:hypothetical protein
LTANQIGSQRGQAIVLTLRPAVFDRNVPAFDKAGFGQSSVKCLKILARRFRSKFVFSVVSPFRLRVSHHLDNGMEGMPKSPGFLHVSKF